MADQDIFELNVDQRYAGQDVTNVHHFQQQGADGTGPWQTALTSVWSSFYEAVFLNMVINTLEIVQIRLRQLLPTQTQQTISARASFGAIVGDGLPPHCCTLIRQHGEGGTRKGTGGSKITGVPRANVESGRINNAMRILMGLWGDVSENNQTDVATGYVFRSGVFRPADGSFRKIVKSFPTPRIITVRSRQIGVGD